MTVKIGDKLPRYRGEEGTTSKRNRTHHYKIKKKTHRWLEEGGENGGEKAEDWVYWKRNNCRRRGTKAIGQPPRGQARGPREEQMAEQREKRGTDVLLRAKAEEKNSSSQRLALPEGGKEDLERYLQKHVWTMAEMKAKGHDDEALPGHRLLKKGPNEQKSIKTGG